MNKSEKGGAVKKLFIFIVVLGVVGCVPSSEEESDHRAYVALEMGFVCASIEKSWIECKDKLQSIIGPPPKQYVEAVGIRNL